MTSEIQRAIAEGVKAERERCARLVMRRRLRHVGKQDTCIQNRNFGQARRHQDFASVLALAEIEITDPSPDDHAEVVQAAAEFLAASPLAEPGA